MANFTALNIEPDEHSDDEVDNTKEIQIEEALKLYQSALKLHSQGNLPLAARAYIALFELDIFRYPESITEFARLEQHPELEFTDSTLALEIAAAVEAAPSTLPQILYSAYKNHGQFIMDCVKHSLLHEPVEKPQLEYQTKVAMDNFALSLASDESDAELWRRAARIGYLLGSKRISRYCLEASVELDDDPTVAEVEPPALEEAFAGEQLKVLLKDLSDETSLSHPIMAPFISKALPKMLAKHIDPYSFLPRTTQELSQDDDEMDLDGLPSDNRARLRVDLQTWTAVGNALCEAYLSPNGLSCSAITLILPELTQSIEVEVPSETMDNAIEDTIQVETSTPEVIAETSEPAEKSPVTGTGDDISVQIITTTTTVPLSEAPQPSEISLPTRKRSQSAAGLQDVPDEEAGAQKRSKRIRRRDTTEGPADPAAQFAEQLKAFNQADEHVFRFVNDLLKKFDVHELGIFPDLQKVLLEPEVDDRQDSAANTGLRDLRDILNNWDETKASTFINANAADMLGSTSGGATTSLTAFLEHSKTTTLKISTIPPHDDSKGLSDFVDSVNDGWKTLQDVIFDWVSSVLRSYRVSIWSDELRRCVGRTISFADSELHERISYEFEALRTSGLTSISSDLQELGQALFELHLDIYCRVSAPNSTVSHETRLMTQDRVERWSKLAADLMQSHNDDADSELALRYLWASVHYATMSDKVSREHKVSCWSDLQGYLEDSGANVIELPNCAAIPEISITAAEREVSRLTTLDFFFNLFQTDKSDPVAIIETLEPVLDAEPAVEAVETAAEVNIVGQESDKNVAVLRDMWKFLKTGSTSLRLFLWQRLREAYQIIGYNTKVFSCHLKCIEVILADIRSDDFIDSAAEPRRHKLLKWLKTLDDLLVKSLTIALNDAATCFEIIDDAHIKSTCAAIAQLNRLLHVAALFDDQVKVGMIQLPSNALYATGGTFNAFTNKLREMQVRAWSLQYTMVKEAMSQNKAMIPTPDNDLADYLALVHYTLGLRKSCKSSNKIFLKMMKVEMLRLKHIEKWEDYLGQVLFDLYGLRLGVGTYLLEDHGCPTENIDRRTVLNIMDQVVLLAKQIPLKDLLKHELRSTIEKMQTAVGQAKVTPQMTHNLRNYTEYLKTSIRPIDFMKAWKGQLMFDSVPVFAPESAVAQQRWYFLLGMISLTKFRSQKRLTSGSPTDDLHVATTFFRLQLQFETNHWETWYRLAQCFDLELEEEVLWSTEKINNHKPEIIKLQRSSIHCYLMALSMAIQSAEGTFETADKLSEMYFDFGMRVYASSREPFSMEAFFVDDFEKHMSGQQGMYKKLLHEDMGRYRAWSHASRLFKESLKDRPDKWMTHFMIGKCLWKMHRFAEDEWDAKIRATKPGIDSILKPFLRAIEICPKPRDGRQEPILEPHYKLVSVVHKAVVRYGILEAQAGADLLQKQTYSINKGQLVTIANPEEWDEFILSHLKVLRGVDKQHWQHRMVARVAKILHDETQSDVARATSARNEYQTTIFTKTMQVVVWKPEAERPGRHCVYMERYVKHMTNLLWITNDKENMELMAKRIRKKPMEFFRFNQLWNEVCTTYLRLIRRTYEIQATMDEIFRNVAPEEFEVLSERVNTWAADPDLSHPALNALREATELKKLNSNLMKATPIDDLINDAYGTLYVHIQKTSGPIPPPAVGQTAGEAASVAPRALGPMSLNNLVMDMNGVQIPVPVTVAHAEPSRARRLGIGRREVLRHAEQLINRGPEVTKVSAPSLKSYAGDKTNLESGSNHAGARVRTGSRSLAASSHHEDDGGEVEDGDDGHDEHAEEGDGSEHENEVAEDADDESGSDLSDVPDMDDIDESTIFADDG